MVPVWMQVDENIRETAAQYFFIVYVPMLPRTASIIFGTVLRASGDTKTPMIASLCSLWIFRVALSFLLVRVLGFGVLAMRVCVTLDQLVRASINLIRYCRGKWAVNPALSAEDK